MSDYYDYHQRPTYYGYRGGFAELTICPGCGRVSLREDAHPANPCWQCGARVKDGFSGKWVKPVYRWSIKPPFKHLVDDGYWKLREKLYDS